MSKLSIEVKQLKKVTTAEHPIVDNTRLYTRIDTAHERIDNLSRRIEKIDNIR